MLSYHSCYIYGTWKSIWFGGRFEIIFIGGGGGGGGEGEASHKEMGQFFMKGVDPSRHHVNI